MTDRARGGRWRNGGPVPVRRRKRWMIAAAVAATALLLISVTGSVLGSLAVLVLAAVLAGLAAVALRALGFGRDHPAVQALATRPWRDGREVFGLALRHLYEVFIVTPNGSRLAPSAVELCMNPRDVDALADIIDLELVNASAAEAYAAEIEASGAQVRRDLPLEVRVVADPAVPAGRYGLRQRRPGAVPAAASAVPAGPVPPGYGAAGWGTGGGPRPDLPPTDPMTSGGMIADAAAGGGPARAMTPDPGISDPVTSEAVTAEAMMAGAVTREALPSAVALAGRALAPNPLLRLVTGDYVTQTRVSGARAGRGFGTELTLPDDPTMSRVHATFTCTDGLWRISGTGRNGLALNGIALSGEEVIRDGDFIRWGLRADALSSRVQIER